MKYRVLPAAQTDLRLIDNWVAANFGETSADAAIEELYETFDLLVSFPEMGRRRPDITSRPVRFFSVRPNLIVYQPGEPLLIHRVFPDRMDIAGLTL